MASSKNVNLKTAGRTVVKVSRTEMLNRIEANKGKFFTVTFTPSSGEERTINCNHKVGASTATGYLNVYSVQDKGIRNIDTRTIKYVNIENELLEVKKSYYKPKK
jgi:hypothetical protein